MAVKLRLRRMGKKKQPVYKVVAADARSPRDGKFIEAIGLYNPKTDPAIIEIAEDRALYWLNVGAQPTTTVKGLLSKKGILLKKELLKSGKSEEEINAVLDDWLKAKEAALISKKKKADKKQKVEEKTEEKSEDKSEEKVEASLPEVTGTASDENSTDTEKEN